jgi:hypothetical protein
VGQTNVREGMGHDTTGGGKHDLIGKRGQHPIRHNLRLDSNSHSNLTRATNSEKLREREKQEDERRS